MERQALRAKGSSVSSSLVPYSDLTLGCGEIGGGTPLRADKTLDPRTRNQELLLSLSSAWHADTAESHNSRAICCNAILDDGGRFTQLRFKVIKNIIGSPLW